MRGNAMAYRQTWRKWEGKQKRSKGIKTSAQIQSIFTFTHLYNQTEIIYIFSNELRSYDFMTIRFHFSIFFFHNVRARSLHLFNPIYHSRSRWHAIFDLKNIHRHYIRICQCTVGTWKLWFEDQNCFLYAMHSFESCTFVKHLKCVIPYTNDL